MQSATKTNPTAAAPPLPESIRQWIGKLDEDGDKLLVRRAYIDLCDGDLYAALIFSQLLYWYLPDKQGASKLRVQKHGHWWVVKSYKSWEEDCRVNRHTAKKAINRLKRLGLVSTRSAMFNGLKILHLRIDFDCVNARRQPLNSALGPAANRPVDPEEGIGANGSERLDPQGRIGRTFRAESITEMTSESTSKAEEPPAPLQAKGSLNSFSSPGEERLIGHPVPLTPHAHPAAPRVAADAAPDELPERFNFARWLQSEEVGEARKLEALFPRDTPFTSNPDAARKFHQRHRTGMLTSRSIHMLVRFYPQCHLGPELTTYPNTLDQLLRKETLPQVLNACREGGREAIEDVRTESVGLDGDQTIVLRFVRASEVIQRETDMVAELRLRQWPVLDLLFAGYHRSNPRTLEAARHYHELVVQEIELCPAWNHFLGGMYNDKWPMILGITFEEGQELQRCYAAGKEKRIEELQRLLG